LYRFRLRALRCGSPSRLPFDGSSSVERQLRPVDAVRFLALVSREPFNYQEWRMEYFSRYDDLDELRRKVASITAPKILSPFPSGLVPRSLIVSAIALV
jgi:hypothetical protein